MGLCRARQAGRLVVVVVVVRWTWAGEPLTLPITMSKGRDAGRAARDTSMAGQVQPGLAGGQVSAGEQSEGLEVPQGSLATNEVPTQDAEAEYSARKPLLRRRTMDRSLTFRSWMLPPG